MNEREIIGKALTIVAVLGETNLNGGPESTFYLYCGMDMNLWQTIREMLLNMKVITIKSNYVTLTERGLKVAAELNKAIQ